MTSIAMASQDAMSAGCLALAFITEPETWPVFAAWVNASGANLTGTRDEALEALTFLACLAEMAGKL